MIKIFNKKKTSPNIKVLIERIKHGNIFTLESGLDYVEHLITAQWNARLAIQDKRNIERLTSYKIRSIHHHTFGCV